jgi:excisionase family DNA binding protein
MELSTSEVAGRLGVSQRQVQRLVASGQLAVTRRIGRNELVDAASAGRLAAADRRRGRSWDVGTAWAALWLLSGLDADWADRQTKYRLRRRLEAATPDALAWACRGRADVRRLRASGSFLEGLRSRLALTGASALERGRDLMSPAADSVEGYCSDPTGQSLIDEFFLVDDPAGNVTMRVTEFDQTPPGEPMPLAVVGVDLMESADPREQAAGRAILEGVLPCRSAN